MAFVLWVLLPRYMGMFTVMAHVILSLRAQRNNPSPALATTGTDLLRYARNDG